MPEGPSLDAQRSQCESSRKEYREKRKMAQKENKKEKPGAALRKQQYAEKKILKGAVEREKKKVTKSCPECPAELLSDRGGVAMPDVERDHVQVNISDVYCMILTVDCAAIDRPFMMPSQRNGMVRATRAGMESKPSSRSSLLDRYVQTWVVGTVRICLLLS